MPSKSVTPKDTKGKKPVVVSSSSEGEAESPDSKQGSSSKKPQTKAVRSLLRQKRPLAQQENYSETEESPEKRPQKKFKGLGFYVSVFHTNIPYREESIH